MHIRKCNGCGASNRIPDRYLAVRGKCGACKDALEPLDAPLSLNAQAFDTLLSEAQVPVLVDFWASWCGPCQMVAPEFEKAARTLSGRAILVKVNTEQEAVLAARYHVRNIPNFKLFLNGRLLKEQAGALSHAQIEQLVLNAGPV